MGVFTMLTALHSRPTELDVGPISYHRDNRSNSTKITPWFQWAHFVTIKGPFFRPPPPSTGLLPPPPPPPPTATKNINIAYGRFYHVYRVSQSASVSSSLPNSATRRRRAKNSILFFKEKKKRKKRKNDRVLCFAFELFCSVNNFKILTKKQNKTKQKRKKRKQKEKLLEVVAGFDPRTSGVWIPHLTAELPKPTVIYFDIKYQFISNMASRTIRPLTYAIPQFPF